MRNIERMERELAEARLKLEALRANQVASKQALGEAVIMRRVLLMFDDPVDEVQVAKADREVRELKDHLSDVARTIAEQEAAIADVTAQLDQAKRAEAEHKAREIEAHAVALERALANLKPEMIEFADICRAAGAVIPELTGMGRSLTDILRHVEDDSAYYTKLLRQRAKALLQPPHPPLDDK